MKVSVTLGARRVVVDFPGEAGASPSVEGAPLEADLVRVRPGLYSLLVGGRSYEVALEEAGSAQPMAPREITAHASGTLVELSVEDERRRALVAAQAKRAGDGGQAGTTTITAPMPGRVAAVPVQNGDAVERGQPLLVLEAMKMESALTAPHAGTVADVLVQPGQTVQQRQPLLRLERPSERRA